MSKRVADKKVNDFTFEIAMDFISGLEALMDEKKISQKDLAIRLGLTEGRVSQVINNPGNLTLKTAVEWGRALGFKIALLAYDDGDKDNQNGPIFSDVFRSCWEIIGKPTTEFDLQNARQMQPFSNVLTIANDNTYPQGKILEFKKKDGWGRHTEEESEAKGYSDTAIFA